jgi:hypothetical protein
MAQRKRSTKGEAQTAIPFQEAPAPEVQPDELRVFPFELRPGDIVTDGQDNEWEVIGHRSVYNQRKSHQVRVQKSGDPRTKSINFWSAQERVTVKRRGRAADVGPRRCADRSSRCGHRRPVRKEHAAPAGP